MLARRGKKHQRSAEKPCDPCSSCEKNDPIDTDAKAAPLRVHNPPKREINPFKYLITSVGSFSSVLYHPLAHLTAFGTPCCKLMTLGFLTPDPHLNRNQPRVQQRKHPTVGGFGHFLSPGPLAGNFTCKMAERRRRRRRGGRRRRSSSS